MKTTQMEEMRLENIDIVVSVDDVMSCMREHKQYEYAIGILDSINASKKYPFAVAILRNGKCIDMRFSETSQSEEESIVQRDLESEIEDENVNCVSFGWCKNNHKETLYLDALYMCVDYIDSFIEEERSRCNV